MPDDVSETTAPTDPVADVVPDAGAEDGPLSATRPTGGPSVLTHVGLLLGGVVLGLFGTVLMATRTTVGSTSVPWGLILALLAVLTCTRGAAWLVGSRRGAALVGLGWVLPTLAFATTNPGGDVLLPDIARTYVYLVGSAVIVVLAVALPLPRGAAQAAADSRARRGSDVTGASDADAGTDADAITVAAPDTDPDTAPDTGSPDGATPQES